MDPVTLAVMATPFLVRAAEKLGEKVWERTSDAAAGEAAGFGRRLLDKLVNRKTANGNDADADGSETAADAGTSATGTAAQVAVRSAVSDVVQAPADQDAQAALRLAVRKLLAADPQLSAEVQRFLEQDAPKQRVGDRAVVIGGSQTNSVNVTGDSSTVTYGGPVQ